MRSKLLDRVETLKRMAQHKTNFGIVRKLQMATQTQNGRLANSVIKVRRYVTSATSSMITSNNHSHDCTSLGQSMTGHVRPEYVAAIKLLFTKYVFARWPIQK